MIDLKEALCFYNNLALLICLSKVFCSMFNLPYEKIVAENLNPYFLQKWNISRINFYHVWNVYLKFLKKTSLYS